MIYLNIKYIDDLTFDIYLKKEIIGEVNFKDKESLEEYLKKLFKVLKSKYKITVEGFYDIIIYIDNYYGVIIHLKKDSVEYYDCFKNQVDMRIVTRDINFLYQVDDIPIDMIDKFNIKVLNNNIFLEINKELTKLEMMNLLENSKLVYNLFTK